MSYNPALPANNSPLVSAEMRGQFTGLKTLIDAVPAGPQGPQGDPGEVSNAALDAAIAGTSANTNAVATLDTPFANDPPTLADMEVLRAKVNETILNGRR